MCEQITPPENLSFQAECPQLHPAAVWHADEVIHITELAMSVGVLPKASRQLETGRERMCGGLSKSCVAYNRILILVSQKDSFSYTFPFNIPPDNLCTCLKQQRHYVFQNVLVKCFRCIPSGKCEGAKHVHGVL